MGRIWLLFAKFVALALPFCAGNASCSCKGEGCKHSETHLTSKLQHNKRQTCSPYPMNYAGRASCGVNACG